ncbi:MAG: thiamine-phosphate diphosphorylase [Planctomycetes bacterium RBG_16_55_9]|nr:MAG: thiamine-phosphate diphosphorylase [Planctomycetes bacterium RBG_16_55_9]
MERAVYRIIDANFNRAREAARSVEEFCRFALNSDSLTRRSKQLRHELSACIGQLDTGRLISSRDTLGDVGAGQKVDKQLSRVDLYDGCTAACKRLSEALRVLAEVLRPQSQPAADTMESLRYTAYTLEKDIVLQSHTLERFKRVRLYIVITSHLPAEVIYLAGKCIAGGADCIQLRAKAVEDERLFALAVAFVKICKDAGVMSIINDRTDVAVAAGADGVHLGQNDLPVAQARKLELGPLIIGKSTHSIEQLRAACDEQPTYVGLGPVFATPTKPSAPAVGLDYVREGAQILASEAIGHVAIGGITPGNVVQVLSAGARSIAVCSAVTGASDPAAACRALKQTISAFQRA